ncbi:hypothetical protein LCGC14_2355050 [marine sediment metagenome]|uniref:Uncharacterized protein n=1 Tax=marine sediment metagenome TaxID=412755 RepID=A0A0F9F312_9ZZZZ
MISKPQLPKDLGIKIGSKTEDAWTTIRDQAKADIEQNNIQNTINELIILKAGKIIKREKEKFKY